MISWRATMSYENEYSQSMDWITELWSTEKLLFFSRYYAWFLLLFQSKNRDSPRFRYLGKGASLPEAKRNANGNRERLIAVHPDKTQRGRRSMNSPPSRPRTADTETADWSGRGEGETYSIAGRNLPCRRSERAPPFCVDLDLRSSCWRWILPSWLSFFLLFILRRGGGVRVCMGCLVCLARESTGRLDKWD